MDLPGNHWTDSRLTLVNIIGCALFLFLGTVLPVPEALAPATLLSLVPLPCRSAQYCCPLVVTGQQKIVPHLNSSISPSEEMFIFCTAADQILVPCCSLLPFWIHRHVHAELDGDELYWTCTQTPWLCQLVTQGIKQSLNLKIHNF